MADAAIAALQLAASPLLRPRSGAGLALPARDGLLLAWLAIEGPTPRARVAQLLWPDSTPQAARNALRQRLFQLKKVAGIDLVAGQETLALVDGVLHDLEDSDDVLAGLEPEPGTELADWLARQRQRRRERLRQSLAELATMAERSQDWADALGHARELLAMDPLREDAHRRLIRLHYLAGDRAAALLAFDTCEQVLKHEVGAAPSSQTRMLLRLIEDAAAPVPGAQRVLPAALRRPPRAVGRAQEVQALLGAWAAGVPFLVTGEPGIGKSRLLDTLSDAWPGATVVRARPGDAAVPLALLARLLDALGARHAGWLQQDAAALHAQLAAPDGATPRHAPRPLRPLLVDALAALPDETALVLDDWQFADSASVDLIEELLDAPALATRRFGFASRSHAGEVADRRIARLRQHSPLRAVALGPFDAAGVAELLASLELGETDSPGLAAALVQRVGGNPLFLLESLRRQVDDGEPMLAQHVAVPPQVRQLVAQRLVHLPERARQLLYIAAVAESDFDVALAESVSGRDVLELTDAWSVLEQRGLFTGQGIAHDVHAEVVLESLPAPIARVLHARVAAWIEQRPHEPARLAAHWRAAGQDARAVAPLVQAALQAWHAARADETFDLFEQAAGIEAAAGHAARAFDLWFETADAMTEIGTPALVSRCLGPMRSLAQDERQHLRVRLVEAVLRANEGDVEAGLAGVTALLGDAIALGDARVECECRFAIGNRAAADGHFDDALQHFAAAERLMRDEGDPRRAAALAATMSLVLGLRGQARLARREQERMLPLLEVAQDRATWTVVCSSLALQVMRQGDEAQAMHEVARAREAQRQASIGPADTAIILRNLVDVLRWSERLDEALSVCEELGARLAAQGNAGRVRDVVASVYVHLGRADLARPLVEAIEQQRPTREREQWRLRLLQHQLARMAGTALPAWPDAVLGSEDLALGAEWALWSGLSAESPWPVEALAAIAARCHDSGLAQFVAPLQALVAWRRVQGGEVVGVDARGLEGPFGMAPWTALFSGRALRALGQDAVAHGLARQALQRLREATAARLEAPFRDASLQRHPLPRELAMLAGSTR